MVNRFESACHCYHRIIAGLNLPYLRVKQLLGEELPPIEIKYGTKLLRKYWDILYNEDGLIKL